MDYKKRAKSIVGADIDAPDYLDVEYIIDDRSELLPVFGIGDRAGLSTGERASTPRNPTFVKHPRRRDESGQVDERSSQGGSG